MDENTYTQGGRAASFPRVVFVAIFVFSAIIGALHRSPWVGFDEISHLSYIAHIQSSGILWPRFEDLRILNGSLLFSGAQNYLNHPPTYYNLLAVLGPGIEGYPSSILVFRAINIMIGGIGFYALLALSEFLNLSRIEEYAWVVALLLSPVLLALAGSVNNDNLAITSGEVALLATFRLATTHNSKWLLVALAAVIAAGMAKLTALLLVGGLVAGVFIHTIMAGRTPRWWLVAAIVAALIAATPYIVLWAQNGSPAPETTAQIRLLSTPSDGCLPLGVAGNRMSFSEFSLSFIMTFVSQWMPACGRRTPLELSMLVIPVVALGCAFVAVGSAIGRFLRNDCRPIDIVLVAGFFAAAVTAAIQLIYSYRHHVLYGIVEGRHTYAYWPDAYPRYYMPLGAIVPIGCILFIRSRGEGSRKALLVTMIVGSMAFSLLGRPSESAVKASGVLDIYHGDWKAGEPLPVREDKAGGP